ncbi:hypothetical protein ABKN59_001179 [Abortiporus biennis]
MENTMYEYQIVFVPVARLVMETYLVSMNTVAAGGLLLYDYLLTLDEEIKYVWKRKKTGISILFILNRYTSLVNSLLVFLEHIAWEDKSFYVSV